MTTYWDMQTVNITNNTGMTMTLGTVGNLDHGEWDTYPTSQIANSSTASPAFVTRSVNAAEVGPGPGSLTYNLPDGTTINLNFDMSFIVNGQTFVAAQAGGVRGSSYTITITCSQDSWHGQGKRYNATITVTASSTGPSSASCIKS